MRSVSFCVEMCILTFPPFVSMGCYLNNIIISKKQKSKQKCYLVRNKVGFWSVTLSLPHVVRACMKFPRMARSDEPWGAPPQAMISAYIGFVLV